MCPIIIYRVWHLRIDDRFVWHHQKHNVVALSFSHTHTHITLIQILLALKWNFILRTMCIYDCFAVFILVRAYPFTQCDISFIFSPETCMTRSSNTSDTSSAIKLDSRHIFSFLVYICVLCLYMLGYIKVLKLFRNAKHKTKLCKM